MLNKVSQQLQEMNQKLDFLDAAKKHLEVCALGKQKKYSSLNCNNPGQNIWLCILNSLTIPIVFQVLYAEQWGLDHSYLYAIAKCPGDTPMLLAPSENPLLQYQIVPSKDGKQGSHGDDEAHQLQAGFPEGLMAYLFAQ